MKEPTFRTRFTSENEEVIGEKKICKIQSLTFVQAKPEPQRVPSANLLPWHRRGPGVEEGDQLHCEVHGHRWLCNST